MDPSEFYDIYRLFLGGFTHGLKLHGVNGEDGKAPALVKCKGPSASQHVMFMVLDAILGIEHRADLKEFSKEMEDYIPNFHREVLHHIRAQVEQFGTLKTYVCLSTNKELQSAFNNAVQAYAKFRSFHMGAALHFLAAAVKGTGSSSFRTMLKNGVDATRENSIEALSKLSHEELKKIFGGTGCPFAK
jgi:hypothetical protein